MRVDSGRAARRARGRRRRLPRRVCGGGGLGLAWFSSAYQLVMSDEFGAEGRDLSVGGKDPLWTAERLYYFPTHDK